LQTCSGASNQSNDRSLGRSRRLAICQLRFADCELCAVRVLATLVTGRVCRQAVRRP